MLLSYSTSQSQFSLSPLLPTLYLSSLLNSVPHPSEKSGPLRDNYQTWQNEIQGKAKSLSLRQTRQPNRREKVSKAKKSETHLLQLCVVSQKYQAINHNIWTENRYTPLQALCLPLLKSLWAHISTDCLIQWPTFS